MPFGSVLANAKQVPLKTADGIEVNLKGIQKLGLRFLGIPHIGMRVRARNVMAYLAAEPGDIVLDLGCGIGAYAFTLGFQNVIVYAVDNDEEVIKKATKLSQELNMGTYVYFRRADATRLPYSDNFFDKIICSDVMEHIPDEVAAIKEIHRVLKPGGKLILTAPADVKINRDFRQRFGHVREYTPDKLMELCSEFEDKSVYGKIRALGQFAWTINRNLFTTSKILAGLMWYPLYILTYFDFIGEARDLVFVGYKKEVEETRQTYTEYHTRTPAVTILQTVPETEVVK